MLNVEGLHDEIEAVLKRRGAGEHVHFLLGIKNEVTDESGEIVGAELHSLTNNNCGTCAGMIVERLCTYIMEQIIDGKLHVHAMPAMYGNTETIN